MNFLFAAPNLAFDVALALLAMLVLIELGMGGGFSEFLDALIPDLELDADGNAMGTGSLPTQLLGWLRAGKVPTLMLIAIFLGVFGVGGLLLQWTCMQIGIGMLYGPLAVLLMLVLSLPFVRIGASLIGDLLPRDETEVVSQQALVGRVAVIVLGQARRGAPAQAKLRDEFSTTHYVMVEPVDALETFQQGQDVLLTARHGASYHAVRADLPALENKH